MIPIYLKNFYFLRNKTYLNYFKKPDNFFDLKRFQSKNYYILGRENNNNLELINNLYHSKFLEKAMKTVYKKKLNETSPTLLYNFINLNTILFINNISFFYKIFIYIILKNL